MKVLRRVLVACGFVSSLLYVVMNVVVAARYSGYDSISQTVSELSAVGAPTRPLWVQLAFAYDLLLIAFGIGVWISAARRWQVRVVGALLVIYAAFGLFWPPMHQRATLAAGGGTISDTLHLVWAGVSVLGMVLFIAFGAAALGNWFRLYSMGTIVVILAFGMLTGISGPRVSANLPTPWVGVWERISILAYLLWLAVLSIYLLRENASANAGQVHEATGTTLI
jgi:hypothetical protein